MSTISRIHFDVFVYHLRHQERSDGTIQHYCHAVQLFADWLGDDRVAKERVTEWKNHLLRQGYAPVTINSMIAALHSFFTANGWQGLRVSYLRIQRTLFRDSARELTRSDYDQLLATAKTLGRTRLALLLETICATGIRVGEVRYITLEAAQSGRTDVALKNKIRTILLPKSLCRKLLKYARKQKIAAGELFVTSSGKSITRAQIWSEMKSLARLAHVAPTKVFPHNLRHLFATTYYQASKDIASLADLLGHSSIETTRIYLMSSGDAYAAQLERLGLVSR